MAPHTTINDSMLSSKTPSDGRTCTEYQNSAQHMVDKDVIKLGLDLHRTVHHDIFL